MFMLADDPHHMHADINYVYYFLALSIILVVPLLLAAWKIMTYLERPRRPSGNDLAAGKAERGASASKGSSEDASLR